MPDKPTIAVFAETAVLAGYLSEIVDHTGGTAVRIGKTPVEAALILACGLNSGVVPRLPAQPMIWLGAPVPEAGVRVLKTPAKAGTIAEALTRMMDAQGALPASLDIAGHQVDLRESLWLPPGEPPVRLTEKEIAILVLLKESAPSTVSRQTMLDKVWAYADGVETHTLETHIYRLRQKIERDPANPQILVTDEAGYKISG